MKYNLKKKVGELENRFDWIIISSLTSAFFITLFLNRLEDFGDNFFEVMLWNIIVFLVSVFFVGILLIMVSMIIFEAIKIYYKDGWTAFYVFSIFFGGIMIGIFVSIITTTDYRNIIVICIWILGIIAYYINTYFRDEKQKKEYKEEVKRWFEDSKIVFERIIYLAESGLIKEDDFSDEKVYMHGRETTKILSKLVELDVNGYYKDINEENRDSFFKYLGHIGEKEFIFRIKKILEQRKGKEINEELLDELLVDLDKI